MKNWQRYNNRDKLQQSSLRFLNGRFDSEEEETHSNSNKSKPVNDCCNVEYLCGGITADGESSAATPPSLRWVFQRANIFCKGLVFGNRAAEVRHIVVGFKPMKRVHHSVSFLGGIAGGHGGSGGDDEKSRRRKGGWCCSHCSLKGVRVIRKFVRSVSVQVSVKVKKFTSDLRWWLKGSGNLEKIRRREGE